MADFVIGMLKVHDWSKFRDYQAMAGKVVKEHGGILLSAEVIDTLEGSIHTNHNVILKFPSAELAQSCFTSDLYLRARELRNSCSEMVSLTVHKSLVSTKRIIDYSEF
jgi:uncharacterized protein (DUF1330 family)